MHLPYRLFGIRKDDLLEELDRRDRVQAERLDALKEQLGRIRADNSERAALRALLDEEIADLVAEKNQLLGRVTEQISRRRRHDIPGESAPDPAVPVPEAAQQRDFACDARARILDAVVGAIRPYLASADDNPSEFRPEEGEPRVAPE